MAKNECILIKLCENMYFNVNFWDLEKNTEISYFFPDFDNFSDFYNFCGFADFMDFCLFWTKIKHNWRSIEYGQLHIRKANWFCFNLSGHTYFHNKWFKSYEILKYRKNFGKSDPARAKSR